MQRAKEQQQAKRESIKAEKLERDRLAAEELRRVRDRRQAIALAKMEKEKQIQELAEQVCIPSIEPFCVVSTVNYDYLLSKID